MPRCVTLEEELAAAIEAAGRGAPPADFAAGALRGFAPQFEPNAPYRAFCTRRGVTPAPALVVPLVEKTASGGPQARSTWPAGRPRPSSRPAARPARGRAAAISSR